MTSFDNKNAEQSALLRQQYPPLTYQISICWVEHQRTTSEKAMRLLSHTLEVEGRIRYLPMKASKLWKVVVTKIFNL